MEQLPIATNPQLTKCRKPDCIWTTIGIDPVNST